MIMKKITIAIIGLLTFSLFSCAPKARVLRMENGINKAEYVDPDQSTTKGKVADAANSFCEKEGKNAVVVSENTTFSGTFDEKTTNAIKTAGVIGGVLGKPNVSDTSAAATNDAKYTTILMFKCE